MKVVMEKIAKLFPAYLMNPANRETFHPRNFCRLRYMYALLELFKKLYLFPKFNHNYCILMQKFECSELFADLTTVINIIYEADC